MPYDWETDATKESYAAALLRHPNDAFKAALEVFPTDTSKALYICNNWTRTDEIVELKNKAVKQTGEGAYLPSKPKVAREIFDLQTQTDDPELKLKALKLYCDVQGYIEKPGTTINNQQVSNRIMVVKDHGDDDSWADKLKQQQQNLIESSG